MVVTKIKFLDEEIIYEKLDNGLEVYLFKNQKIKKYYMSFTTKYGGVDNEFVPLGEEKMKSMPKGIAHFLEHQMFEQEDGVSVFSILEESGTDCNAHTSNKETSYEIWGTNNILKNLELLLDFVQTPYFESENVEVEKGIIKEEILMIRDRVIEKLYEKMLYNLFNTNPYKYSIIGNVSDINKIDADMLKTCYNTFYHPANMFLIVCGNFNEKEVLEVIKNNQSKKEFQKEFAIKLKEIEESNNAYKEYEEIKMDVDIPKVGLSIKIPFNKFKNYDEVKLELYIYIIFSCLFDDTSLFYERLKKEKIIVSPIGINFLNADSHLVISLINESKNYEEFISNIKNELLNINISNEDFERKKKVLLSSLVYVLDTPEMVNDLILNDIITYGKLINNKDEIIKNLTKKELDEIIKKLAFNNNIASVVVKKD